MQRDQPVDTTLVFTIEPDFEDGGFVAFWDDPSGGGITTQAETLPELVEAVKDAVLCHFTEGPVPTRATLHFVNTELELA